MTVLAALGVLLWGVTWLRELSLARKVRVWHVAFPQTGGLGAADEVLVNGIRKGVVSKIALALDHVVVERERDLAHHAPADAGHEHLVRGADLKSTRLDSSHAHISHA